MRRMMWSWWWWLCRWLCCLWCSWSWWRWFRLWITYYSHCILVDANEGHESRNNKATSLSVPDWQRKEIKKTFGKFLSLSTMLPLMRGIFTPRPLSSSVCYLGLEPRNTQRIISPPMMISIMHRAWKGSYGNLGNDVVEWLLVPFSAFVAKSLTHQWHHCMNCRSL